MAPLSVWISALLVCGACSVTLAQRVKEEGGSVTNRRNNRAFWLLTTWMPCSLSCGSGVQTRTVTCHFPNGTRASPVVCLPGIKPAETRNCNQVPCSPEIYFVSGPCSQTCGGGYIVPLQQCRRTNAQGKIEELHNSHCSHLPANVPTLERCENSPPCKPFYLTTPWSPCSATCGTGRQSRNVRCMRVQNSRTVQVAHRHCRHLLGRKKSNRLCHNKNHCPNDFKWLPGQWSLCKVNCEKHRYVKCFSEKDHRFTDNKFCEGKKKPLEMKRCINIGTYTWKASSWTSCSVTCGMGIQTRKVSCHNPITGKPALSCAICMKPADARICNTYTPCTTPDQQAARAALCEEDVGSFCRFVKKSEIKEGRPAVCKLRLFEENCRTSCVPGCDGMTTLRGENGQRHY